MKLIRFVEKEHADPSFGVVINNHAVSFSVLQNRSGISYETLNDSRSYLADLPHSEQAAGELFKWGEQNFDKLGENECFGLDDICLLEPVEAASLFDFGLTPRHLQNSLGTMLNYEKDDPKTGIVLQAAAQMLAEKPNLPPGHPELLAYYKCNMNSISGDGVEIPWPLYTSRLDIEPELAVVYGNSKHPIAGYCIFNDISARDVQVPEFIGGFCRSKDMDKGNQLGPYLVTPDEVGDPYQLDVKVTVNGNLKFQGSTSEISHRAEDIFACMETIASLKPGSVMGFGTIPDCTGLDNDEFIDPGARIEITFEKLGTLRCRFAEPSGKLFPSRWPLRAELEKYH